jgi:hypothetical protein
VWVHNLSRSALSRFESGSGIETAPDAGTVDVHTQADVLQNLAVPPDAHTAELAHGRLSARRLQRATIHSSDRPDESGRASMDDSQWPSCAPKSSPSEPRSMRTRGRASCRARLGRRLWPRHAVICTVSRYEQAPTMQRWQLVVPEIRLTSQALAWHLLNDEPWTVVRRDAATLGR